jgi:hypothetical protein
MDADRTPVPSKGTTMIIIWRGFGALALGIAIVVCLVTNIITSKVFEENNYFQAHLWPKLAALGITGASCWFLGRYLNGRPARIVTDPATGKEIKLKIRHELMFIKLEYWGLIFGGIALAILVVNLAG